MLEVGWNYEFANSSKSEFKFLKTYASDNWFLRNVKKARNRQLGALGYKIIRLNYNKN